MTDYTLSDAYWSRMRETSSPPQVPWTDSDDVDEVMTFVVAEEGRTSSLCTLILTNYPSFQTFFLELVSYTYNYF